MTSKALDTVALEGDGRIDLKQQLDLAMATIIKLRGTAEQITETEIRDDIEKLQRAIQNWIRAIDKDLKDNRMDYRHMFIETFGEPKEKNKELLSALKMMGIIDDSDSERSLMWMLWLARLNTCIHVVFCRGIWACLQEHIFSREYPVGVEDETGDTFKSIFKAMKGEDDDEDARSRADRWKSDTIRAFIRTDQFRRHQRDAKNLILETLEDFVLMLLKDNGQILKRHTKALETDIFEPALSLHRRMSCSSFRYVINTPRRLKRGERHIASQSSSWKLQDMVKWRPIDSEDIDGVFECLYPSVYRLGKTKNQDVLVCEAVILAYDQGEGPEKPSKNTQRPSRVHTFDSHRYRSDSGFDLKSSPPERSATFPTLSQKRDSGIQVDNATSLTRRSRHKSRSSNRDEEMLDADDCELNTKRGTCMEDIGGGLMMNRYKDYEESREFKRT